MQEDKSNKLACTMGNKLSLSTNNILKLRHKSSIEFSRHTNINNDNSDDEDNEILFERKADGSSSEKKIAKECRTERSRLVRSYSADLVILRAANSPFNNKFLYVTTDVRGELTLKMDHVNPHTNGQGRFKRRKKIEDEAPFSTVYSYTSIPFNKTIAVRDEDVPTITLVEQPTSPVCCSDPCMFVKSDVSNRGFRLQSSPYEEYSIDYRDTGEVFLTKEGSRLAERDGTPMDYVDSSKPLSDLASLTIEGFRAEVVTDYQPC